MGLRYTQSAQMNNQLIFIAHYATLSGPAPSSVRRDWVFLAILSLCASSSSAPAAVPWASINRWFGFNYVFHFIDGNWYVRNGEIQRCLIDIFLRLNENYEYVEHRCLQRADCLLSESRCKGVRRMCHFNGVFWLGNTSNALKDKHERRTVSDGNSLRERIMRT